MPTYNLRQHLSKKGEMPMIEKAAGSNLWFRGNVLEETANELHVLIPSAFSHWCFPLTAPLVPAFLELTQGLSMLSETHAQKGVVPKSIGGSARMRGLTHAAQASRVYMTGDSAWLSGQEDGDE